MKISCIPVSLYPDFTSGKLNVNDWIKLGSTSGLDGIDVSPVFLPKDFNLLKDIGNQVSDQGLESVMFVGHPDFTHPDPQKRQTEIQQAILWVKMAAALGCRYLRTTAGQHHPGLTQEQGVDLAVSGMREVAKIAYDLGVTLAYENHYKSAFWDYPDFSQPHNIFLEILAGCDVAGIGVNFDLANPVFLGESPLEILEKIAPRIVSIHVNDLEAWGEFNPVLIGTGVVPLKETLARLKELGYDGWLCIEEYSRTGPSAVGKACQWIRENW